MFPSSLARLATTLLAALITLASACLYVPAAGAPAPSAPVVALSVDGAIGPAYADYLSAGIADAARSGAQLVVIEIDTPGGLDTAMRSIIRTILTSPVPVACYVAPSGARAASAGTYILYACHIAAMAPGTNLGAATPVAIGPGGPVSKQTTPSAMEHKQVNDAAAYIRGLAQLRGRNADWAERAVREAVSLSADEALQQHVVDLVAPDLPRLLAQLDGRPVTVLGQARVLHTAGARIDNAPPGWRIRLLAAITNPSLALILMTVGVYGLIFEFMSPGAIAPGVFGAICLLVGLYGLQLLPVNYSGLALIVLGIAFMVAEAFLPTFGAIGVGGVIAFVIGALLLFDTGAPGFGIPLPVVATIAVLAALLVGGTVSAALRARRRPAVTGSEALIGSVGEMIDDAVSDGWANVGGETWRITTATPLVRAQRVRVLAKHGAQLEVAPEDNPAQGG